MLITIRLLVIIKDQRIKYLKEGLVLQIQLNLLFFEYKLIRLNLLENI